MRTPRTTIWRLGTTFALVAALSFVVRAANNSSNSPARASGGGTVTSVTGTPPIASSGGATPAISITAATSAAAGSMSAAQFSSLAAASAEWVNAQIQAALAVDATFNEFWWTSFSDTGGYSLNGVGTGVISATIKGGVLVITSPSASIESVNPGPSTGVAQLSDSSTQTFYCYGRVKSIGPTGANNELILRVSTPALGADFAIGMMGTFLTGGSNTNWIYRVFDGTTVTGTDSGVAFDTASFHDEVIQSNGTTVTFKLDGATLGTTASSGIGAGKAGMCAFSAVSGDATTRSANVDKMFMAYKGQ